jgi:DNA-binding transcriptional ArsR family regulator
MDTVTIDNFRLKSSYHIFKQINHRGPNTTSKENSDNRFIKGPIPLKWILAASELPGKSLEISMVLWFLKGVTKKHTVKLNGKLIRSFGVSRSTLYRGLAEMENAGLISIQRQKGRSPMVTILTN